MRLQKISKILFLALVTLVTSCVDANSDSKSNETPMFGGKFKSLAERNADIKFIEQAISDSGSKEAAAEASIKKGWEYVASGDSLTAMKRFNQAWLLNPENYKIYWGFGAVLGNQSKFEDSIQMFEKAENLAPENVNLITDYGRTYVMWACTVNADNKEENLLKGVSLFRKAENLDSNNANLYTQWAYANSCSEKYLEAWEMVKKAQLIDSNAVDPKFIKELSLKFPAPVTGSPPNNSILPSADAPANL